MFSDKPHLAEQLLNNWPDGLIGLDHYGKVTFSNDKATAILGWTQEQMLGQTAHDLLCSKAVDYAHNAMDCPMCGHQNEEESESLDHFEAWWVGSQGVYMNLDVRVLSPELDDLDIAKVLTFTECSTGTVSQYEARRLAMFAEFSPVPILEIALPMSIEFANPAMTDLMVEYGFNDEGIPNVLPPNLEMLVADAAHLQETLINQEVEYSDVSYIWTLNPLYKNKKQFVQVYGLEVTELRKAQHELEEAKNVAERASEAKSHFLANMSHEIRTPMNAIVGFTEILLKTQMNDKQVGYCNKIKISSSVLLEVINDILDFSKIEAGKLTLENIPFNLIENIEVLADLFADRANDSGVELVFDVDQRLPAVVSGDPLRFKQVMINLVSNAFKFTRTGYIEVVVKPIRLESKDCRIRVEIRDTGKGIPKDKQAKLFAPFTQEDETTTRKYGGTGLGLSICRSLVELMDGKIGVKSKEGQGSVFFFEANLGVLDNSSILERQLSTFKVQSERKTVLLLQTNPVVRRSIRHQLSAYGLESVEFESGVALVDEQEWVERSHEILAIITDQDDESLDWIQELNSGFISANKEMPLLLGITPFSHNFQWPQELQWPEASQLTFEKPLKPSIICRSILTKSSEASSYASAEAETDLKRCQSLDGFHVLVVDDNLFNRELVLELLADSKAVLDTAEDGRFAVEKVQEKSYDFILMDIQMPMMDGYEATKIIKENDPNQVVIALTANAIKGDRERFIAAGFDDYLSKPVDAKKLNDLIYFWADRISSRDMTESSLSQVQDAEVIQGPSENISESLIPSHVAANETNIAYSNEVIEVDTSIMPDEYRGLKVGKALKLIGDKKSLYIKLMSLFTKNYSNVSDELLKALKDEDSMTAGRIVHTIKGSASNLGAEDLRKCAFELEDSIINNSEALQGHLSDFCARLDETLVVMDDFLEKFKHFAA